MMFSLQDISNIILMARCVSANLTIGEISQADNKRLRRKIWTLYKSIAYSLDRFDSSEIQAQVAELSKTLSVFGFLFDKINIQPNYYYLGYKLGNAPSVGGLTREEILELINNAIDHIDVDFTQEDIDRWNSYSTSITQNAQEILLKANQSQLTPINNKLSEHEASISLTAQQIALKVSQEDFNLLGQQVASYDTVINQTSQEIALKASKSELDAVTGRIEEAEASLSIQAGQIQSKASTSTVNALGERLVTAESSITQTALEIASKVSKTDFDALGVRVGNAETSITQTANQIQSKAEKSTVDTLTGRVATAESSITQNAEQIELKVAQTDFTGANVVSKINLAPDNIKIQSKNINLQGAVTISSFDSALAEDYNIVRDAAVNASTFEYVELIKNDLQGQIDGAIDSYFEQVDPSLTNYPAASWTTNELKQAHANDTYTNNTTGASWKWVFDGGNWFWQIIADTATQKALVLAGQAKGTADGKSTTYKIQPTTPYFIGDLWARGTAGELLVCNATRLTGSFTMSDWGSATDAIAKLNEAKAHADSKVTELQNALGDLAWGDTVGMDKIDPALKVNGKIKADVLDVGAIIVQGDVATKTVAQGYANSAVNSLQVGGRNLFRDGNFENNYNLAIDPININSVFIGSAGAADFRKVLFFDTNGGDSYCYLNQWVPVKGSTTYTMSFEYRSDSANRAGVESSSYLRDSNGSHFIGFGFGSYVIDGNWHTMSFQFTTLPGVTALRVRFGLGCNAYTWLAVDNIKIEIGNKATDWTPAIEDTEAYVLAQANLAEVSAKAHADGIVTAEEQRAINDATAKLNEAKQHAETKAGEVQQNVNTVVDKTGINSLPTGKVIIYNGKVSADLITAVGAVTAGSFNLGNGKFKVLSDGTLEATGANISGTVTATSGNVGGLSINSTSLSMGNTNTWATDDKSILISPEYTLNRKNGTSTGQTREVAFDLYSNPLGSPNTETYRVTNNINNTGVFGGRNTAIKAIAQNANENIAIHAIGGTMLEGAVYTKTKLNSSSSYYMTNDDYYVLTTVGGTIYLPSNPLEGRTVVVSRATSNSVTIHGNGKKCAWQTSPLTDTLTCQWSMTILYVAGSWRVLDVYV